MGSLGRKMRRRAARQLIGHGKKFTAKIDAEGNHIVIRNNTGKVVKNYGDFKNKKPTEGEY